MDLWRASGIEEREFEQPGPVEPSVKGKLPPVPFIPEERGADTGEILSEDDSLFEESVDGTSLTGKIRSHTVSLVRGQEHLRGDASWNSSSRLRSLSLDETSSRFTFDTYPVLPAKSIVSAIILSNWDNILGPRALHVWLPKPRIAFGRPADEFLTIVDEESNSSLAEDPAVGGARILDDDDDWPDADVPLHFQIIGNDFLLVRDEVPHPVSTSLPDAEHLRASRTPFRSPPVRNNSAMPDRRRLGQKNLASAIRYVVEHTLHAGNAHSICQVTSDVPEGRINISLYTVPPEGVVALAATFKVTESLSIFSSGSPIHGGVPFALSLVMDYAHLEEFYHLQSLLESRLKWLTAKVRVYLSKQPEERLFHPVVDPLMIELCEFLSALRIHRLVPRPPLDGSLSSMAEKRFFERALTSHLQTGGCSIVVGKTAKQVNQFLAILSRFNSESDLYCSLSAVCPFTTTGGSSSEQRGFYPGAAIQGLVPDMDGFTSFLSSSLLSSPRPITLIDLSRNTVKQGPPLHHHSCLHLSYMSYQLATIDTGFHFGDAGECTLHNVKEASAMVVTLAKELLKLPPSKWEGLLDLFRKQISYKALTLVRIADDELQNKRDQTGGPPIPLKKHLKEVLGISDEADFLVVLAEAEKLRPGIYEHAMTRRIVIPSF